MRLRRVTHVVLVVASMFALSACTAALPPEARAGGGDCATRHPTGQAGQPIKVKAGVLPIIDAAGLVQAKQAGYFACEGLEVTIERIANLPAAMASLEAGTLHFSLGNYVTGVVTELNTPGRLRYIADAYQGVPNLFQIVVPQKSPITTMADLKHKTVAIAGHATIAELLLRSAAAAHGLAYGKDLTVVEIPFPTMIGALLQGQVDAALLTEPFLTVAGRDHGMRQIYDTMKEGETKGFPIAGYVTSGTLAQQRPALVDAFRRALARGQQDVARTRTAVEQVLPSYTQIPAPVAALVNLGNFPTTLEATRIQRVADVMLEHGMIDRKLDVKAMLAPAPGPGPALTPGGSPSPDTSASASPAALGPTAYRRAA